MCLYGVFMVNLVNKLLIIVIVIVFWLLLVKGNKPYIANHWLTTLSLDIT
ncbi:protein of unknown function [Vibrio tapetis subsp. tapetis]|uniref:Uncharacterized protein n=1 Tax=Vibrio tapetis subsp. tapetis TaxID=1671868 RepID=A0A2N8ZHC6_9VIBR|nr:protein of unknown function [Vibrio tapetis subsp. tapetis]